MPSSNWRTPFVILLCGGIILTLSLGTRHTFGLYLQPMTVDLERQIRALAPAPSAFTIARGKLLKVHRAHPEPDARAASPGTVLSADAAGIVVETGCGTLRLLEVQLEGRKALPVGPFLGGFPIPPGSCLDAQ